MQRVNSINYNPGHSLNPILRRRTDIPLWQNLNKMEKLHTVSTKTTEHNGITHHQNEHQRKKQTNKRNEVTTQTSQRSSFTEKHRFCGS